MAEATKSAPPNAEMRALAEKALADPTLLKQIVDALAGDDRRARQASAGVVHELAQTDASALRPYVAELADALHRPELQTRWEILGVFEKLVAIDARLVDKALPGAETALHDEESGVVRLAAFRLLAAYGATTANRSERVWPFIDEAIRCYHGDPEFMAMLTSVQKMVCGSAADSVKKAAAERMMFDAENAKGLLKRKARAIVDCAPKGKK